LQRPTVSGGPHHLPSIISIDLSFLLLANLFDTLSIIPLVLTCSPYSWSYNQSIISNNADYAAPQQGTKMITIDTYTANAQRYGRQARAGQYVQIHESCDDRERDDFKRGLSIAGLFIGKFVRYMPRKKMDVYKIERQVEQ
jgi:hypothetical protein